VLGDHIVERRADTPRAEPPSQSVIDPEKHPAVSRPLIQLYFLQGGARTPVGTITAGADYSFATTVSIPQSAHAGPATLEAVGKRAGRESAAVIVAAHGAAAPRQLPFTGSHVALELLSAGVALLLGAALVRRGSRGS